MQSKSLGNYYERQALDYLLRNGLVLIKQNFLCRKGEIDLICLDQSQLVFIEVRYRRNSIYGNALESVNYSKQHKIKKTAYYFLFAYPHFQHYALRFDIIAIDQQNIQWIKHAF